MFIERLERFLLILICVVPVSLLFGLGGCGEPAPIQKELTVKVHEWSDGGSNPDNTVTYTEIRAKEELYSGYASKVTVKKVSEDKIVLSLDGCLVEPNENGTIDMRKNPLKKITVKSGQTIELVSQTMDAGVRLEISYE